MIEMAWDAGIGVPRSLTDRFASGLIEILKLSTTKMHFALVCEIAGELGGSVPGTKVLLTSVKS